MTKKDSRRHEQRLAAIGVYKPFVSANDSGLCVESYPLTALIAPGGCDPETGPFQTYKISDCSLARIGQDPVVTTGRIMIGQDALAIVGNYLAGFHAPAYARAKEQDDAAVLESSRKLASERTCKEHFSRA
jgi:hypothetical protein